MGISVKDPVIAAPTTRRQPLGILWRPIFALVVFAVLLYGRDVYGRFTAESRVTPEVRAALVEQPYVDVNVVLDFPPEDFHIKYFQSLGTMSGVEGKKVRLRRVRADRIEELARNYWILRVEPLTQ